jgi:hypothetical protein
MRRSRVIAGGAVLAVIVAVGAASVWLLSDRRPVSAATSPDGSWSVAVVGQRRLDGAYDLVVEVRDRGGQVAPGGAFVVGLTRDLRAAERDHAVCFLDSNTAQVGSRTLQRARFIKE